MGLGSALLTPLLVYLNPFNREYDIKSACPVNNQLSALQNAICLHLPLSSSSPISIILSDIRSPILIQLRPISLLSPQLHYLQASIQSINCDFKWVVTLGNFLFSRYLKTQFHPKFQNNSQDTSSPREIGTMSVVHSLHRCCPVTEMLAPWLSFLLCLLLSGPGGRWDSPAAKLSALFVTILKWSPGSKNITAQCSITIISLKLKLLGKRQWLLYSNTEEVDRLYHFKNSYWFNLPPH